ncbi:MAG TPA: hypothetical protein VL944_02900 [Candidatus Acidoferrum sp.]|nr:hypothetical protein [Candidatus Acidoferrum sp.]
MFTSGGDTRSLPTNLSQDIDERQLKRFSDMRDSFTTTAFNVERVLKLGTHIEFDAITITQTNDFLEKTDALVGRIDGFLSLYRKVLQYEDVTTSTKTLALSQDWMHLVSQTRETARALEANLELLDRPRKEIDKIAESLAQMPKGDKDNITEEMLKLVDFVSAISEFRKVYTEQFVLPEISAVVRDFSDRLGHVNVRPRS